MPRIHPLPIAALALACASPRPVLYPNAQLERVGQEVADVEIEECFVLAEESGAAGGGSEQAGAIARDTAERAGAGAAAGAVGGAIRGGAGIGAAIGAATAATWGFVRGGLRWLFSAREPDRMQRAFVERCLRDRGYDVLGWK